MNDDTRSRLLAHYKAHGCICLPVPPGTKRATLTGWSEPDKTEFEIANDDNIALRLDRQVDVDHDCEMSSRVAEITLPLTRARIGRPSARGLASHHIYDLKEGSLPYRKFCAPDGRTLLEQRTGHKHYTLIPPSILPESKGRPAEAIAWLDGEYLPNAPDTVGLGRAIELHAVTVALALAFGINGFGHESRLEFAGFVLRLGLTVDEAIEMGEAISTFTNNTERRDVIDVVRSTATRLASKDTAVTGGPALSKRIGAGWVEAVEDWLGKRTVPSGVRPRSEAGDAEHFAARNADLLRYDHRRGRWLLFMGHTWQKQTDGEVMRLALESARSRQEEALKIEDSDQRNTAIKWAFGGESRARLVAMLDIAKNIKPLAEAGNNWDTDPMLMGCPNGVLDLKTGQLRQGLPEDRITMRINCAFDPTATAPNWEKFVSDVFEGNLAMVEYIQRALGYTLTGDCREEVLFFTNGEGSNGKGTLMNTVSKLMGDYADDVPFHTLELNNRNSNSNDIAKTDGKRMITSSETADTQRLNEARIKALTGRDPITARYLYQEFFTFQPVAKYWLATNKRPEVHDDSIGFWRRIQLIPFNRSFKDNPDQGLKDRLLTELPGIINWMLVGCLSWQRIGLCTPPEVKAATEAYRDESDLLAPFFDAKCELGADKTTQASILYTAYVSWCHENGIREPTKMSQRGFGLRMKKQFGILERRQQVHYVGIALRRDRQEEL